MTNLDLAIFQAKISEKKEVSVDAMEVTFELDRPMEYTPGEYIWLKLPELRLPDPRGPQRAFTIISSKANGQFITILFQKSSSGFKQTLSALPCGSPVQISGPFGGTFTLHDEGPYKHIFLAGGSGIAAFLNILFSPHTWEKHCIELLYSFQSLDHAPWIKELRELAKTQPNFVLHEAIGPLQKPSLETLDVSCESHVCISGSLETDISVSGSISYVDVASTLLREHGVLPENMHYQEHYPTVFDPPTVHRSPDIDFLNIVDLTIKNTSNHLIFTDVDGLVLYANPAAERITGYTFAEMKGNTPRLWGGLMDPGFYQTLWHTIKVERKPFIAKLYNRRKNGERYAAIAHISPINNKEGKLVGFFATEEDITELDRLDQTKTDFVSLVSHQLRTPLTSLNWNIEMLLGGDYGKMSQAQKDVLAQMQTVTRGMNALVTSVLNVSRIEMGVLDIQPTPTDFAAACEDVLKQLHMKIDEKNQTITEEFEKELPKVPADPKLLQNVMQNLISNASKYTPTKGKICIKIYVRGNEILTEVSDNGAPIPMKDQPRIFTRMFRASDAVQRDAEGNGLGLYIAKSIVETAGGKIGFTSKEGEDTVFWFSFPLTGMVKKAGKRSIA